jgi:putative transposase
MARPVRLDGVGDGQGGERDGPKHTRFVESAIRQAAARRSRQGHPIDGAIHHSDAGSQYTSVRFGEKLSLSDLRPSIGSVGDADDNALAETTIGLYKNECIRADSPFRRGQLNTLSDAEYITADYVSWHNQQRLMHRLGRVPPAEAEAQYYSQHVTDRPADSQNPRGCMKPGMVHRVCVICGASPEFVQKWRSEPHGQTPSSGSCASRVHGQ